jgi:hypothetical protein
MPFLETIAEKEFTASARLLSLLELRARGPDEHRSMEDFIDSPGLSKFAGLLPPVALQTENCS